MCKIKGLETIFFDLGNTLVHYHEGKLTDDEKDFLGLQRMCKILNKIDKKLSVSRLYEEFYVKWSKQLRYRKIKKTEYDAVDFLRPIFSLEIQKKLNDKLIKAAFKEFQEPTARFAECEEDLGQTLEELKQRGYNTYIISNSPIPGYCHDLTLKTLGVLSYFKHRFYSYDLDFRKPNPKMFQYAMKKTKSNVENSLFVGDSLKLDIKPALEFNMKAILFNKKKLKDSNKYQEHPNFICKLDKLSELLNLI